MMTYYLDIGAQRVQEWITATPELVLLRGASQALTTLTAKDTVTGWLLAAGLGGTCEVAEEAGEKDGVVVVRSDDQTAIDRASRLLMQRLREALPRVQWAGWWVEADSYLVAHERARVGDPNVRRVVAHPALYDIPVAEQCNSCRQENRDSGTEEGSDCRVRRENSTKQYGLMANVPGKWRPNLDFDKFARLGGLAEQNIGVAEAVGRKDSRNHLALIKADGNKIGQLFEEIATHAARLPRLVTKAVNLLNEATKAAVEGAAREVTDTGAGVLGVIPHYVGGNDVLASVPAPRAWQFAVHLAGQFELVRSDLLGLVDVDLPAGKDDALRDRLLAVIDDVSLGVGMVFAHASHPLAQCAQAADRALLEAKLYTSGSESAIAWVDLTAEGMGGASIQGSWRQVIGRWAAKQQLNRAGFEAATALFDDVDAAGRARLAQVIRESTDVPALARERAVQWCKAGKRPDALLKLAEQDALALLPLLSQARWWPELEKSCASK